MDRLKIAKIILIVLYMVGMVGCGIMYKKSTDVEIKNKKYETKVVECNRVCRCRHRGNDY